MIKSGVPKVSPGGHRSRLIHQIFPTHFITLNSITFVSITLFLTGGSEVCKQLGFASTISDEWLDKILETAQYSKHYCGHYHINKWVGDSRIIYNDIIEPY